ncbi:MAG: hypothetical protein O7E51_00590 [Acidobacteria bacterium]|nr:hypothetical protein [Acidobacteriota bacterium]
MQVRRALAVALCVLAGVAGAKGQQSPPQAFDPSGSDERAIQVADELAQALGGVDAWNRARFLRYDYVTERDGNIGRRVQHLWDKHTGRYRVDTMNEGKLLTVLFNVNSKEGSAYIEGQPVAAEENQKWVDFGYQRYINDGYWFYMPFKWKEPGVSLKYEGEEEIDGTTYDVVRLTYDNVGLTPDDIFWGYVNKQTHLMDQWAYVLKGRDVPRTYRKWSDWQEFGGIQLALEKVASDDPTRKTTFRNVGIYTDVQDRYFTASEATLSEFRAGP